MLRAFQKKATVWHWRNKLAAGSNGLNVVEPREVVARAHPEENGREPCALERLETDRPGTPRSPSRQKSSSCSRPHTDRFEFSIALVASRSQAARTLQPLAIAALSIDRMILRLTAE
jgi:hypothetical protein